MTPHSTTAFIDRFCTDLNALGVRAGMTVMGHASLSAFGQVPGGADTIIDALCELLTPQGTLLMPALSYLTVTRRQPVFDLLNTPSCVGIIPETFRLRQGVLRSLHPTHSVCGWGKHARDLLAEHALDHTPCGPHSPFHRLPQFDGSILMLGCGLKPNTSMHAIEELVTPPYLFSEPITYTLIDENGRTSQEEYIPHNFNGWEQRYDRVANLLPSPQLRSGTVAGAPCHLIHAPALWKAALAQLLKDPLYFVEATPS
jgi:aminoglycoside 3-N-acetyltransferase